MADFSWPSSLEMVVTGTEILRSVYCLLSLNHNLN